VELSSTASEGITRLKPTLLLASLDSSPASAASRFLSAKISTSIIFSFGVSSSLELQ